MGVIPSLEALPGELGLGCGLMKVGALAVGWFLQLLAAAFMLCRVPLVSLGRFLFLVFASEERRGIWHVDNGESQRHGAVGVSPVGV
jgi:hypothetical protein